MKVYDLDHLAAERWERIKRSKTRVVKYVKLSDLQEQVKKLKENIKIKYFDVIKPDLFDMIDEHLGKEE